MTRRTNFKFRLYTADHAPNSTRALANLNALCRLHLEGQYEIEVVNVFQQPKRALTDGVFMTPTLLKLAPGPELRIVGTLSQSLPILQALGLETVAS